MTNPQTDLFTANGIAQHVKGITRLGKLDYHVKTVPLLIAQDLVSRWHYAGGGANTATFRHGLIHTATDEIVGVAWWIPPTKAAAIATYDGDWRLVLALSRLVISPDVPQNGASFLLGRSERLIKQDARFECGVTYADNWQGHTGAIYRACNWEYVGCTKPESVFTDDSGRMMGRKRGPRTLTHAEMKDAGFTRVARSFKHKFRKVWK